MIRINLLAVERAKTKRASRAVTISPAHRVTIGASLILIVTVLGIGWWFLSLRQKSADLDRDIARAEAEAVQLRTVLAQVQKFESRKAQLTQRVTLIEQLRRGQASPVHVLDEISKSLPERVWLTELKQVGIDFTINGYAASLPSLSDFVANLEATKWFKRPVEILDSQVQTDKKAGDLVRFSIKGTLNDPEAPPPPPPAGRGRGAAGRGAPPAGRGATP
ncbi:MAG TPA: PilN domain-containing protein [Vicinamibacterales bacterium]|nr:PilN domain-containing protein [Vicinamibacterales bacterium]